MFFGFILIAFCRRLVFCSWTILRRGGWLYRWMDTKMLRDSGRHTRIVADSRSILTVVRLNYQKWKGRCVFAPRNKNFEGNRQDWLKHPHARFSPCFTVTSSSKKKKEIKSKVVVVLFLFRLTVAVRQNVDLFRHRELKTKNLRWFPTMKWRHEGIFQYGGESGVCKD